MLLNVPYCFVHPGLSGASSVTPMCMVYMMPPADESVKDFDVQRSYENSSFTENLNIATTSAFVGTRRNHNELLFAPRLFRPPKETEG